MPKHPGSLQLQPRDIELLKGLFESRLMTIAHAAEIYFGGKRESAKKRLQRLKAAGLIRERSRKPYEPSILHLSWKGVTSLRERAILAEYPPLSQAAIKRRTQVGELTLKHELQVMEIKAALYRAANSLPNVKLLSFSTWPLLNEFTGRRKAWAAVPWLVRPDGVLRASMSKTVREIYIELDRSTESHAILAGKAARYAEMGPSNRVKAPSTTEHSTFRHLTRVHIITTTDLRKNNIEKLLSTAGFDHLRLFRVSTLAELVSAPSRLLE